MHHGKNSVDEYDYQRVQPVPSLRRWSGHRKEEKVSSSFDGYALRDLVRVRPGGALWEYFWS